MRSIMGRAALTLMLLFTMAEKSTALTFGQILSGAGAAGSGMRQAETEQMRIEQLRLQNEILRLERERLYQQTPSPKSSPNFVDSSLVRQQATANPNVNACIYNNVTGNQFQISMQGQCPLSVYFNTATGLVNFKFLDSALTFQQATDTQGVNTCVYQTSTGQKFNLPIRGVCPTSVWYDQVSNLVYLK